MKSVETMVNVIESHVELRGKSVETMVNVIESYVELRVKSVEEMVNVEVMLEFIDIFTI
jgi:hypothetical protein